MRLFMPVSASLVPHNLPQTGLVVARLAAALRTNPVRMMRTRAERRDDEGGTPAGVPPSHAIALCSLALAYGSVP